MKSQDVRYEPPRFDAYQGTVEMPGTDLVDLAWMALGDEPPQLVHGMNGYSRGYEIRREGCRAALVLDGGQHKDPHIIGMGEDAVAVAALLRRWSNPDIGCPLPDGGRLVLRSVKLGGCLLFLPEWVEAFELARWNRAVRT